MICTPVTRDRRGRQVELTLRLECIPGFGVVYLECGREVLGVRVFRDLTIEQMQQRYQDLVDVCLGKEDARCSC